MKGKLIIIGSLITLIVLLLVSRAARQAKSDQLQNPYSDVVSVKAVVASTESFPRVITETGILAGRKEAMIAAETGGQVTHVLADVGDFVKEGEALVRVDDELYGLEADRARISYEKVKMDFDRIERLHKDRSASDSDLESVRLMMLGSEVGYKIAKKTYEDATIRAPFTGVVASRFTEVGQLIGPGVPVIQLIDQGALKLILQIPEESIRFVRNGSEVEVIIDAAARTVEGKVTSVGSKAASGARTFPVEVRIDGEEGLKSGMFARANIQAGQIENAIVLPRVCVLPDAGRSIVFVSRDKMADKAVVQVLGQVGDRVAVVGVAPGDVVVTTGNQLLVRGTALDVTIAEGSVQ